MRQELTHPVLIATALTPASDAVARAGIELARRLQLTPLLVHAVEVPAAMPPIATTAVLLNEGDWREQLYDQAGRDLAAQAERTGLTAAGGESRVLYGPPAEALLEAAGKLGAAYLVLGRGEASNQWKLLGSTADRLLRRATCPLLVVHPNATFPPQRALAAVDLQPLSGGALRVALRLLRQLATPPPATDVVFALDPAERRGSLQFTEGQMERFAEEELGRFLTIYAGTQAESLMRRVIVDKPRRAILEAIDETGPDLVLLGTHSRRGLDRMLLGSVATALVYAATTSLLVVPPEAAEAALEEHHEGPDWHFIPDAEATVSAPA